jgi:N-methylhydantoinase A
VKRYLAGLAATLRELGVPSVPLIMRSRGGIVSAALAAQQPVTLFLSGPAGGVIGASFAAERSGVSDFVSLDMGGTSNDVAVVRNGTPLLAAEGAIGPYPVRTPMVDVNTIGAGGGSVAWIDGAGGLRVGPRSAGAEPGPACYGRGGDEATVTDASVVLGYLNPDYFAGGEVRVDAGAARGAVETLAARVGLSLTETAWGIHDVVNETMASAARVHVAERGRDPRRYALLCTGGAGPVHAWGVARKLGIREIVCPPSAGVASALGLLVAPARVDRVATVGIRLDASAGGALEAAFRRLEDEARAVIGDSGLKLETATVRRLADGRFTGQGFDLVVDLPPGPYADGEPTRARLAAAFETAYREKFALTPPAVPIEFINIRVAVRAPVAGADVHASGVRGRGGALKGTRRVYFPEHRDYVDTSVYDRARLATGAKVAGPAVVEEEGSTLVIGPGATGRVAASGNLIVTLA